jgi:hypothetical protein
MTVEDRMGCVARKLHDATERQLKPFGAETHAWRMLPVVDPIELNEFEMEHGVMLPDEYRAFLTRVGRGGAGPAYGLNPFERVLLAGAGAASTRLLGCALPA